VLLEGAMFAFLLKLLLIARTRKESRASLEDRLVGEGTINQHSAFFAEMATRERTTRLRFYQLKA
jgi:hypothetical protein